ncbi:MAG: response regulator [Reinekea sp.]|jgi:CheY-like chemotaxis protein
MDDKQAKNTVRKTALVVDDSKLARYVLKEMLVGMGIKVETANSAEEGLGFLSASAPDVIFMDHMMPGMDGFQAVQAIKKDPKTANIPIIMYTSKEGEVYVDKARSFGAVGVLPKKLRPVELEKVLEQLKLVLPKASSSDMDEQPARITIKEPAKSDQPEHSLEELALSASEDLEKDSMRGLFRQLFVEQRDRIKRDQHELVDSLVSKVTPIVVSATRRSPWWRLVTIIAVLGGFVLSVQPIYRAMDGLSANTRNIAAILNQQTQDISNLRQQVIQLSNTTNAAISTPVVSNADALEWAVNQGSQLPYGIPLNTPENEKKITTLVAYLDKGGFVGNVFIYYHAGEFCETTAENGHIRLAYPDQPVTSCTLRTFDVTDHEQEGIAAFESYLSVLSKYYPDINIRFSMMGTAYRQKEFPEYTTTTLSIQWNEVAAQNNRFEFRLQSKG